MTYNAGRAEASHAALAELHQGTRQQLALIIGAGFALSLAANLWLSRTMSRRLGFLSRAAEQVASRDLTGKPLQLEGRDEIAQVALAFNQMSGNLKTLVSHIKNASESMASASQEICASSEEASCAVNRVAEDAEALSQGARRQKQEVQATARTVQQFSAGIDAISATVQQLAGFTQANVSQTEKGRAIMDQAAAEMERINQATGDIAHIITELGHRSQAIGQIVDLIGGIASQTNLLALNAAIEAARAGDQGRGFAVVAEEVRKLAEQSQTATGEIAHLISQVQADTARAVAAMENSTAVVAAGSQVIVTGARVFQEIGEVVEGTAGKIRQIAAAMENLTAGTAEILRAAQVIDAIATQVEDAAGQMAAGTQQQATAMEEITASAESLAGLGEELLRAVGQFRLAAEF